MINTASKFACASVVGCLSFKIIAQPLVNFEGDICDESIGILNIVTDRYAHETSWKLLSDTGEQLFVGKGYADNSEVVKTMCLVEGNYTFEISDSHGDGICCGYGEGRYSFTVDKKPLFSGGNFADIMSHSFNVGPPASDDSDPYYADAAGKKGYPLKTALYEIIKDHNTRGYSAVWSLINDADIDHYFDKDLTILDIYSEKVMGRDSHNFEPSIDQCGQYRKESDCYNREHSFPKSWFGGKIEPMNSDGHHIFAADGYVNAKRGNWPYGEVGFATYVSSNGSKVGLANSITNFNGVVFEPIDEFKGDLARAYFYMATRYEGQISTWEGNNDNSDAVLNGNNTSVFEPWLLELLKRWHKFDPVNQKERDRNNKVYQFQGNRNPYIDHPEFVFMIWGE
jgi:endonuclease I